MNQRKRIKSALRAAEAVQAQERLQLTEPLLLDLIKRVRAGLSETPCDGTQRIVARWCAEAGQDFFDISDGLGRSGAMCDCEVLANIHPETVFATYDIE